jgi:hypothetical protein
MHWSIGLIVVIVIAAAVGAWYSKTYPGSIPYVT